MGNTSQVGQLGTLLLLLFSFRFTSSFTDSGNYDDNRYITYPYGRSDEIKKHCDFIRQSASELEPDDNRGDRIKKELSFTSGDWYQDTSGAPLLPFDYHAVPKYVLHGAPLQLVSFWVVDVDPLRRDKNAVSVSGIMEIGISRTHPLTDKSYEWSPRFSMSHGVSALTIPFEGIYIESDKNGGECLVCLLGNATFPKGQSFDSPVVDGYGRDHEFHLLPDDQVLLFLRYPKYFTLATREITGQMRSLNQKSNVTYFDEVHISTQFGFYKKYNYGSEELVSKACDPYPYLDKLVNENIAMFKGDDFCERLYGFSNGETFSFFTDAGGYNQNQNVGPFVLPGNIGPSDWNFNNTMLMIQDVRCEAINENNGTRSARVSAVLRVIQAPDDPFREEVRTGLSSRTLSAEGIWRSSDGQLCMVGCIGPPSDSVDRCSTRICLYLPLTFSIKQRSLLYGTISSMNEEKSYPSLKFEKVTHQEEIVNYYHWNRSLKWSYNYSKIDEAIALQKRHKPSKLVTFFRSSFLQYPSLTGTDIASVSLLADALSSHLCAIPHISPSVKKTTIDLEILSMGALFGRYQPQPHQEKKEVEEARQYSIADTIPVAGQLNVISNGLNNISLFFEGLYDPRIGCMYVVGCRNVPTSKKFINDGGNLEGGMDCLIEATIQYPPRNARWLLNPKMKMSINSNRNSVDSLYLNPINLNTFLALYSMKLDDGAFRRYFEGILRTTMLSVVVLCTWSQSIYMYRAEHSGAYTSLVMLGILSLGYSVPLITGDDVLPKWKEFRPSRSKERVLENLHWLQVLRTVTKSLLLTALLLTAGLAQRVWDIRSRQPVSVNRRKIKISGDKIVFLITLITHAIGLSLFHVTSEVFTSQPVIQLKPDYASGGRKLLLSWFGVLESYAGVIQDLFLLPQIIGNTISSVQGKPLRKAFYFGITTIRCFLHAYDYLRDPYPNIKVCTNEYIYVGTEFYTKLGNIIAGIMVLVLAGVLYNQQRTKCKRNTQRLMLEVSEDVTPKSDIYQVLLSE